MPFADRTPLLELLENGRTYRLAAVVEWTPRKPNRRGFLPVTVPAGFNTDFASVPRIFWVVIPPAGSYSLAAIVHDYLYRAQPDGWTRKRADHCFKTIMAELGVPWWKRSVMFRAVRIGGGRW